MNQRVVRRSIKKRTDLQCSILYNNINGFKGKSISYQNILNKLDATIVVLCETKLANINKVKEVMPKYDIIDRCVKSGKGGLMIAVKKDVFGSFINVTVTSTDNKNIVVGRISSGERSVRIIACYAPQEKDAQDIREEFFEDVAIEINKSRMAEEEFIVLGDLNAKIETDQNGCLYDETSNGMLLLNIVNENGLDIVNFSSKCSGKWTHVVRTSGKASRLDYVLTNPELHSKIESMIIDEECLFCPFSQKMQNGEIVQQYSDHNAILLQLTLPRGSKNKSKNKNKEFSGEKVKRWKITEDGLKMFQEQTNGGGKAAHSR